MSHPSPDVTREVLEQLPGAIRRGDRLYLSGHVSTVTEDRDTLSAARAVFRDFLATAADAGFSREDIVSVGVFLADFADFDALNVAWKEAFPDAPPTRTTVQVGFAEPELRFELNGIAEKA